MTHSRGSHSDDYEDTEPCYCDESKLNPSYDPTISPEKRLADFLGKYSVVLNGTTAANSRHKQEILDYVSEYILPDVRKRAWQIMASRVNSHGFMLLMSGDYELKEVPPKAEH